MASDAHTGFVANQTLDDTDASNPVSADSARRLGATVTEIPVNWRDIGGSTFSVRRHSAAVFGNEVEVVSVLI